MCRKIYLQARIVVRVSQCAPSPSSTELFPQNSVLFPQTPYHHHPKITHSVEREYSVVNKLRKRDKMTSLSFKITFPFTAAIFSRSSAPFHTSSPSGILLPFHPDLRPQETPVTFYFISSSGIAPADLHFFLKS